MYYFKISIDNEKRHVSFVKVEKSGWFSDQVPIAHNAMYYAPFRKISNSAQCGRVALIL